MLKLPENVFNGVRHGPALRSVPLARDVFNEISVLAGTRAELGDVI